MKTFRPLRSIVVTIVASSVILATAACGDRNTTPSTAARQPDMGQASYITADSLEELAAQSPVIVVAEVSGRGEAVNMARDPNNVSEPDPSTFILGQVYHVTVQRYVKGSGDDVLDVLQPEGFVNKERIPISQQAIEQSRATYPHIPMDAGVRYLLFLKPTQGFPSEKYYTGVMQPWRFTIPGDGMANPESPWQGAPEAFPALPAATLIDELERLVGTP